MHRFITPIRYRIEKILPGLIKKYAPEEPYVLDHGCGDGRYSELFKETEHLYQGIDINKHSAWAEKYPQICLREMDGTNLDYKDETFNFLISITSLEHIKENIKAVSEMHRVLNKGCKAIVIVPTNHYWLFQVGRHCYHHQNKEDFLDMFKEFEILHYEKIGGPFSFLFLWGDIWLSQAIVLPFWLFCKITGKKFTSELNNKILNYSLHWYMNFSWTRKIYMWELRIWDWLDERIPFLANHHCVVIRK